jgi:hypothetical protein
VLYQRYAYLTQIIIISHNHFAYTNSFMQDTTINVVIGAGSAWLCNGRYYTTFQIEKMPYDDAAGQVSMASCYIEA